MIAPQPRGCSLSIIAGPGSLPYTIIPTQHNKGCLQEKLPFLKNKVITLNLLSGSRRCTTKSPDLTYKMSFWHNFSSVIPYFCNMRRVVRVWQNLNMDNHSNQELNCHCPHKADNDRTDSPSHHPSCGSARRCLSLSYFWVWECKLSKLQTHVDLLGKSIKQWFDVPDGS